MVLYFQESLENKDLKKILNKIQMLFCKHLEVLINPIFTKIVGTEINIKDNTFICNLFNFLCFLLYNADEKK